MQFSKNSMPSNWLFLKCGNQGVCISYLKDVYYPISSQCKVNYIKWCHKRREPYFQGIAEELASYFKLLYSLVVMWSVGLSSRDSLPPPNPPSSFFFAVVTVFSLIGYLTCTFQRQVNCGHIQCFCEDYSLCARESKTEKYFFFYISLGTVCKRATGRQQGW